MAIRRDGQRPRGDLLLPRQCLSPNGAVVQGPASSPLEHFQVTIDATGAITIDASKTVAASVRARA